MSAIVCIKQSSHSSVVVCWRGGRVLGQSTEVIYMYAWDVCHQLHTLLGIGHVLLEVLSGESALPSTVSDTVSKLLSVYSTSK